MTPEEGANRILFHSNVGTGSFLDMLRPYRGLHDHVLSDLKEALRAFAPRFVDVQLSRDHVSALWAITCLGRLWALEPGGMLRRNRLITDEDLEKLSRFLGHFDYAVMVLLAGQGAIDEAFASWDADT